MMDKRWLLGGAAFVLAVSACEPSAAQAPLAGLGASQASAAPSVSPTPAVAPAHGTALAALAGLAVKGRAPLTGYSRAAFGPAWQDVDHNGCDTRNDILRRDLTSRGMSGSCTVLTGVLHDPYTAKVIAFRRGVGTSTKVQIDHVVALGDAWQMGAQRLTASARLAFANDPLELLAVDGPTNQRKGDSDAASWLPPNKAFRCTYVARQIAVKARYHLAVTAAEKAAAAEQPGSDRPPSSDRSPYEPADEADVHAQATGAASCRAPGRVLLAARGDRRHLEGDPDGVQAGQQGPALPMGPRLALATPSSIARSLVAAPRPGAAPGLAAAVRRWRTGSTPWR